MYLRNGEQSIHLFIILVKSFNLSFKAFLLYVFCIFLILVQFVKDEASILPLSIALLIPSKELELIKPAASPNRKILSLPVIKSFHLLGLDKRHASVFIGAPKEQLR